MALPDLVFNEDCLAIPHAVSTEAIDRAFDSVVKSMAMLVGDGVVSPVLRSEGGLWATQIPTANGEQWTFAAWCQGVDRETRTLLQGMDSKVPMDKDVELDPASEAALLELEHSTDPAGGQNCFSAAYAHYRGDVLVSLLLDDRWNTSELTIYILSNGQLHSTVALNHVACEEHADAVSGRLRSLMFANIVTKEELFERAAILYPHLKFSPDLPVRMLRLDRHLIANVTDRLARMNETARRWREGPSHEPTYLFSWSPESESTMQDDRFVRARLFKLPDGTEACFEYHLRFSKSHRIHFRIDRDDRTFVVGYIGDHLPTSRYTH